MAGVVDELEEVLRSRATERPEGSYTTTLLDDPELLSRKIMEEAFEATLELGRPTVDQERLVSEAADLVYHLLVGLVGAGCSFADVEGELARRRA
jgi:phosphoribosyl-ATP pyrophosphohydrolase